MKRFPPVSPEVKARLLAYHNHFGGWASLHVVLGNKNIEDKHVIHAIDCCIRTDDHEGRWLAKHLLVLSKTQRLRLSHL